MMEVAIGDVEIKGVGEGKAEGEREIKGDGD